jgi:hypothetical protein
MFKKAVAYLIFFISCGATSFAENVPQDVVDYIKERAAKEYPGDYSTQLYVVKKEKKSYLELEKADFSGCRDVLRDIMEKASEDFPGDFSTQLYVVKKECSSYQELNK